MEITCVYVPFARPALVGWQLNSHHCRHHQHTRKPNCSSFREAKRCRGRGLSRAAAHLSPARLRFGGRRGLEVIARWKDGGRFSANCSSDNHSENAESFFKGFSKLAPDLPWDHGSLWTTMATYFFLLHIPLSFGGLSFVAQVLHQEELNPQTKAIALLLTQTIELIGAMLLVQSEAKLFSPCRPLKFCFANVWGERGWLKASIMGIAIISLLVILTSPFMELFFKSKAVKNIMLEEILSSSVIARCSCFVVYCIITPFFRRMHV